MGEANKRTPLSEGPCVQGLGLAAIETCCHSMCTCRQSVLMSGRGKLQTLPFNFTSMSFPWGNVWSPGFRGGVVEVKERRRAPPGEHPQPCLQSTKCARGQSTGVCVCVCVLALTGFLKTFN